MESPTPSVHSASTERPRLTLLGAASGILLLFTPAGAVEIPERGTDQIAHFCMVAHGGSERWETVRDMRFTHVVTRYGPGNETIQERAAEVYMRLQPRRQCRIETFTEDGKSQTIIYDGEEIQLLNDGVAETDSVALKRARRRALSLLYMAGLPFNLDDEGVSLSYRGEGKIGERDVYHLRARIIGGKFFSPADTYDYFIDKETYRVAQLVYTNTREGVSYLVWWSEMKILEGILRPVLWDYMASPRQKATSVEYKDLQINSGLDRALFEID